MKRVILISIITLLFSWAVYDFISSDKESGAKTIDEVGLDLGKIAPDFELETITGETVRLSDFRGSPVIVNFWATWCPPCRAEIPDFQKLYDNHDVEILAVNLTPSEKSDEVVTDFVDEFAMTFPVLMDVESSVSTMYQVQAYPTSYIIDSNGHIRFSAMGPMSYDLMLQQLESMN